MRVIQSLGNSSNHTMNIIIPSVINNDNINDANSSINSNKIKSSGYKHNVSLDKNSNKRPATSASKRYILKTANIDLHKLLPTSFPSQLCFVGKSGKTLSIAQKHRKSKSQATCKVRDPIKTCSNCINTNEVTQRMQEIKQIISQVSSTTSVNITGTIDRPRASAASLVNDRNILKKFANKRIINKNVSLSKSAQFHNYVSYKGDILLLRRGEI